MFNGFQIPSSLVLRAYPKRLLGVRAIPAVLDRPDLDWQVPIEQGALKGVLYEGDPRHSAILHFYGAGMSVDREVGRLEWLNRYFEMTVGCLDYGGYGATDLEWNVETLVEDGVKAFDALEARQKALRNPYADSTRIHLQGFSMGAAVAVQVALRRPQIASLILLAPAASWSGLEAAFLARYPLVRDVARALRLRVSDSVKQLFDIEDQIRKVTCPTLIIHGDADQTVPIEQGQRLLLNSGAGTKKLVVAAKSNHCTLPYNSGIYASALSAWLWSTVSSPKMSAQDLQSLSQL
ncbi:alpha/beta hydrolase family protein [Nevskia ramosa]|uniref:alpha/beta hydrolase family protein n=1 Tax=Nevskia ramosa TaxID=64002 RepID=UPI0023534FDC|nr:alpha/beta hydrolase [Nevskia ramosa]